MRNPMRESAKVIDIQDHIVVLSCIDQEQCKSCSNSFCGHKDRSFQAFNKKDIQLQKGDIVNVEIPTKSTIIVSFKILILPLIMFILFYFIALKLLRIPGEPLQGAFGLLGLGLAFLFNLLTKKRGLNADLPQISELISNSE